MPIGTGRRRRGRRRPPRAALERRRRAATRCPTLFLNACGVLTAKASAEAAIKADAEKGGYAYTFVRPGQLFGGPYDNNVYLGTLFQLDKDVDERDVLLGRGDVARTTTPSSARSGRRLCGINQCVRRCTTRDERARGRRDDRVQF